MVPMQALRVLVLALIVSMLACSSKSESGAGPAQDSAQDSAQPAASAPVVEPGNETRGDGVVLAPEDSLQPRAGKSVLSPEARKLQFQKLRIREELPEVVHISVADLAKRMKAGETPLLIDVRSAAEFEVSHLPGARRADQVEEALATLKQTPKDREIIVYCSIGYRSSHMADKLKQYGFEKVRNLEGSIFEWANAGHPVYRGDSPTDEVHPYDREWGQLLERQLWSEIE